MYKKFSDEKLIEAYSAMIDYSGTISDDLSNEIESRGGLKAFIEKIERKNILSQEINRVSQEVYSLTGSETNGELIKQLLHPRF